MPHKKGIRIAAIAVTVAGLGIAQAWFLVQGWWGMMESVFPARTSRTASVVPVAVTLTDDAGRTLRMEIPAAYLVRAENRLGGAQQTLWIETQLPHLQPASASPPITGAPGSDERNVSLARLSNGIYIQLNRSSLDTVGYRRNVERRLTQAVAQPDRFRPYRRSSADRSGLMFYEQFACAPTGVEHDCTQVYKEEYLSSEGASPPVYITCTVWDLQYLQERLGCTVRSNYRGFRLTYVIRHSQLHRWAEFEDGIRRLLDPFTSL